MTAVSLGRKYMHRCAELHRASHDPDRQVAAVIVDQEGAIVAEGANAPPAALRLSKEDSLRAIHDDPSWKYFMLEHAERNAIAAAHAKGLNLAGMTMYGTLYPCADCARAIVSSGISRLVVPMRSTNATRDEKWLSHYRFASLILRLANVQIVDWEDFDPEIPVDAVVSKTGL